MGYFEVLQAFKHTKGTDKYLCSEWGERQLKEAVKDATAADIRNAINIYRNHFKKLPAVDIKDLELKARFIFNGKQL